MTSNQLGLWQHKDNGDFAVEYFLGRSRWGKTIKPGMFYGSPECIPLPTEGDKQVFLIPLELM